MIEKYAFDKSVSLLSGLGQYHWRGKVIPGNVIVCDKLGIDFHQNEDGDACFHTSILLNSIAWKYKATKDKSLLQYINNILSFYEIGIKQCGHLIRDIVKKEAYDWFIPEHKHSNKTLEYAFQDKGPMMKYSSAVIDSKQYMIREDISLDAMSNAIVALYYVYSFVSDKSIRSRVKQIIQSQYEYYENNNWSIKHNGKIVRYGNHKPSIMAPLAIPMKYLMEIVVFGEIKSKYSKIDYFINKIFRTYLPLGISVTFLSKQTKRQFNNYMFLNTFFAVHYSGKKDYSELINRLIQENEGEENIFSEAISCFMKSDSFGKTKWKEYLINNFPDKFGRHTVKSNNYLKMPVPLTIRTSFNTWEESPYCPSSYINDVKGRKVENGFEDFLQAYWMLNN